MTNPTHPTPGLSEAQISWLERKRIDPSGHWPKTPDVLGWIDSENAMLDAVLAAARAAGAQPASSSEQEEAERLSTTPWVTDKGFNDVEDLLDMGRVGQSLIETITDLRRDPRWANWMPADGPAEIVFDLVNALADSETKVKELEAENSRLKEALFSFFRFSSNLLE